MATDPMPWVLNGMNYAVEKLYTDNKYHAIQPHIESYQRDAIAALAAGQPVPNKTPAQEAAHATLAIIDTMLAQFDTYLSVIEGAAYKDPAFWKATRWFDPTPPITVDPGEGEP